MIPYFCMHPVRQTMLNENVDLDKELSLGKLSWLFLPYYSIFWCKRSWETPGKELTVQFISDLVIQYKYSQKLQESHF